MTVETILVGQQRTWNIPICGRTDSNSDIKYELSPPADTNPRQKASQTRVFPCKWYVWLRLAGASLPRFGRGNEPIERFQAFTRAIGRKFESEPGDLIGRPIELVGIA